MAALTEARNTRELHVGAVKYNYDREVASGTIYYNIKININRWKQIK